MDTMRMSWGALKDELDAVRILVSISLFVKSVYLSCRHWRNHLFA